MSNTVDKLFKEKLEGHSLPPSTQAWEKLEAKLSKKNRSIIWFRVAAVIAVAGLLFFALMQQKENAALPSPLTQRKDSITHRKTVAPLVAQKENKVSVPIEKKQSLTKQNPTSTKKQVQDETTPIRIQEENSMTQVSEEKLIAVAPTVTAAPAKKPMKLTFSLPTLEPKKEVNQEVIVAATDEKKSTLQKAASVAHEIRTGDVLGSLREAKDDLFALEFKKDKTKKQQ